MDLDLKKVWLGLVVFFCIAMCPSESGDSCDALVNMQSETLMRMVQNTLIKGNILVTMVAKAMKSGDNSKMIKGIKGLQIMDLNIPNIEIIFLPPDKIKVLVEVNITVAGKSFIGGKMQITVVGLKQITVQVIPGPKGGWNIKVIECKVTVKSCKTNLPSSMLPKIVNKFLDSTLGKVMPGVLCPAADMLMEKLVEAFEYMLGKKPIGGIGFIYYEVSGKPLIVAGYMKIVLKIKIEKKNGEIIQFECLPLPDNLPPCKDKMSAIYLPSSAFNGFLILVQPLLNTVLTKVKGSVPTSDQLKKILPNVGLPAGKKMKVQISHKASPTVSVSPSASFLITSTEVSFLDVKGGKKLLTLKMKQKFSISFVLLQEHLAINLKAGSCKTEEISSTAGDVKAATQYMETVMENYALHCNGVFSKNQIPLPNLMNVTSTTHDAELAFGDDLLVFHRDIQPYGSQQMAVEMKKQCNAIKLR